MKSLVLSPDYKQDCKFPYKNNYIRYVFLY